MAQPISTRGFREILYTLQETQIVIEKQPYYNAGWPHRCAGLAAPSSRDTRIPLRHTALDSRVDVTTVRLSRQTIAVIAEPIGG